MRLLATVETRWPCLAGLGQAQDQPLLIHGVESQVRGRQYLAPPILLEINLLRGQVWGDTETPAGPEVKVGSRGFSFPFAAEDDVAANGPHCFLGPTPALVTVGNCCPNAI